MKHKIILPVAFSMVATQVATASVDALSGSLLYSDRAEGGFNSLVYKKSSGRVLRIFDEGLSFSYDSSYDASNLSPDGSFSVVHFSESGLAGQKPEEIYLCAFVRMSDGCIIDVKAGGYCAGEWSGSRRWENSVITVADYSIKAAPTASEIYQSYASRRRDFTQVSSPRILSYLLEGTAFDNVLACDPPREATQQSYIAMLTLLQSDGDIENAERLNAAMSAAGLLPVDSVSGPARNVNGWTTKSVTAEKANIYSSEKLSDVTKAYLVRGDIVSVVTDPASSLVKFRYQKNSGGVIEKWIRCEDIDFCSY